MGHSYSSVTFKRLPLDETTQQPAQRHKFTLFKHFPLILLGGSILVLYLREIDVRIERRSDVKWQMFRSRMFLVPCAEV